MTDDELAMAYADGELDAISVKRFERRMAEMPELADAVRVHRALRETLARGFAPVAEVPVPARLAALLEPNVVEFHPKRGLELPWRAAASIAASLAIGAAIGQFWKPPSIGVSDERLMASASLGQALDRQLASDHGAARILLSYRDHEGRYCRVFAASAIDGIACRENRGWAVQRTQTHSKDGSGEYRQAGSSEARLMAAAQQAMAGEPLDLAAERAARDRGWR